MLLNAQISMTLLQMLPLQSVYVRMHQLWRRSRRRSEDFETVELQAKTRSPGNF